MTPQQALAQAERAAAALWVEYPPTPWWFFPAAGAWVAAMVFALDGLRDRPAVFVPVVLALVVLEIALLSWMQRQRGTWPRLRSAPAEFRPALRRYFAGVSLVVAAIVAGYLVVGVVVAAIAAFVGTTGGLMLHERSYAAAARRTRERFA